MKNRIDSLKQYLHEVVKLETENYRIYVEKGQATAVFNKEDQFLQAGNNPSGTLLGGTLFREVFGVIPAQPAENFHMMNDYSLSLHVQKYGGDYDALIRLVLFWLNDQLQGVTIGYVIEQNNADTVDIWFDMDISEGSKNDPEGGVHVC